MQPTIDLTTHKARAQTNVLRFGGFLISVLFLARHAEPSKVLNPVWPLRVARRRASPARRAATAATAATHRALVARTVKAQHQSSMSAPWRFLGITYARFSQVSANLTRSVVKTEFQAPRKAASIIEAKHVRRTEAGEMLTSA